MSRPTRLSAAWNFLGAADLCGAALLEAAI